MSGSVVARRGVSARRRALPASWCYSAPWLADAHSGGVQFYGTACGGLACRLVREQLLQIWPDLSRAERSRAGVHGALSAGLAQTGRALHRGAVQRGRPGGVRGGRGRRPNPACTVEESALPFPDLSFDRVLLVHGLETAENARALLREVWRVLKDDGRLLVVAPNRVGVWAHVESTPFGHGQPYSPGQIGRLLAANLFRVERREFALYLPPTQIRLVLRTARLWERAGRRLTPTSRRGHGDGGGEGRVCGGAAAARWRSGGWC